MKSSFSMLTKWLSSWPTISIRDISLSSLPESNFSSKDWELNILPASKASRTSSSVVFKYCAISLTVGAWLSCELNMWLASFTFFDISWILRGTFIAQPLSLKYFFISPKIVGVAKEVNSNPLVISNLSMA